jgi:hypothetical protein
LKIRGDIRKSRCTTVIKNTGGKFAIIVNYTELSKALAAKFATAVTLVTLMQVANNGNNIRLLTPFSELEGKKIIYMLTLLPKGVQTK